MPPLGQCIHPFCCFEHWPCSSQKYCLQPMELPFSDRPRRFSIPLPQGWGLACGRSLADMGISVCPNGTVLCCQVHLKLDLPRTQATLLQVNHTFTQFLSCPILFLVPYKLHLKTLSLTCMHRNLYFRFSSLGN